MSVLFLSPSPRDTFYRSAITGREARGRRALAHGPELPPSPRPSAPRATPRAKRSPYRRDLSGVLAGELQFGSLLRPTKSGSHRRRSVKPTSVEPPVGPSEPWGSRHLVKPGKLLYESRYNMEPVSRDKEKARASTQATVADKSKATKEPEVTETEKKKHEEHKSVSTSKPKKTVAKIKMKKARNVGQTSYDPTKLEDSPVQVLERFKRGCECVDDQCFKDLNPEVVYRHRLNIAELTKAEHDMYLMGVTMACLTDPYQTARHTERRRLRAQYVYQGRRVCLDAFLYLENCTHYQIKRIRKHLMTHGVTPRVHGNHGKVPHNTFSLDIYKIATEFLKNFIEVQETKQKTKLAKNAPLHLPPDVTRKTVHDLYTQYCKKVSPNVKNMGYSTFRRFMKVQFPQVKFAKLEFVMRNQSAQSHCTAESDARDDTGQQKSPKSELEAKGGTILPLVITSDLGQSGTYVLTPIRKLQDCTVSYQVTTRGLIVNSPAIAVSKTKAL